MKVLTILLLYYFTLDLPWSSENQ